MTFLFDQLPWILLSMLLTGVLVWVAVIVGLPLLGVWRLAHRILGRAAVDVVEPDPDTEVLDAIERAVAEWQRGRISAHTAMIIVARHLCRPAHDFAGGGQ